jgi:hypothetical protein
VQNAIVSGVNYLDRCCPSIRRKRSGAMLKILNLAVAIIRVLGN